LARLTELEGHFVSDLEHHAKSVDDDRVGAEGFVSFLHYDIEETLYFIGFGGASGFTLVCTSASILDGI
jgi:hypothetical protein